MLTAVKRRATGKSEVGSWQKPLCHSLQRRSSTESNVEEKKQVAPR